MAATSPEILADASSGTRAGRRLSSAGGHVDGLTGLRGFAALVVVFVHGSGHTAYPWLGLHGYGPIALFVLSGFLLIQPWSRWLIGVADKPSVSTFARRRIWRIFPAYLVVLLVTALVLPGSRPLEADGWFRALTLTNTFGADGLRPGMEHTWSLGTELSWYAAVPLVAVAVATLSRLRGLRHPVRPMLVAVAIAFAVSAGWRYYVMFHVEDFGRMITFPLWLPGFIICFMLGALVAHLLVVEQSGRGTMRAVRWFAGHQWLVIVVALALALLGNSPLGGPWTFQPATFSEVSIRTAACTLLAVVLLVGVAAGADDSPLNRLFSMRWLVATGRWSYGIYLWHMPAMLLLADGVSIQPGFAGLAIWLAILLAVAIPLGALTYHFVERPAIAWSKGIPLHLR
ncbi:acyltransferase [Knoellia locipacati]|uniref:Acyltransferase n=1 Tax=Knoellia locipacati TaxID=882824 RepID=A0A512T2F1_9MICO|nr:acyltransferase [Knoellia locipacati]GEQ14389.1 acyltransferase [Knoellia locipacati]